MRDYRVCHSRITYARLEYVTALYIAHVASRPYGTTIEVISNRHQYDNGSDITKSHSRPVELYKIACIIDR